MSVTDYATNAYSRYSIEQVIKDIVGDCRCIKDIQIVQDPMYARCCVRVSRIDMGIWEWNDNVIA